jgi:pyrimidine deaminase RibD-like protein
VTLVVPSNDDRLSSVVEHLRSAWLDPLTGLVAAGIYDGKDRSALAVSQFAGNGRWSHAENIALQTFVSRFGRPSGSAIAVVTLAPCTHLASSSRVGPPCAALLAKEGIRNLYVGAIDLASYKNTEADYAGLGLNVTFTSDPKLRAVCARLAKVFELYGARVNEDLPVIKKELLAPFSSLGA